MSRKFTLSSEVPSSDKKDSVTIAVLGNSGVGKSTLVCRLLKQWNEISKQKRRSRWKTLDTLNIIGRDLNVHLVNTSSINTLIGFPLPNCDVFVLVYSIVDGDSFESACNARDHILRSAKRDVPIIFVANKTDIAGSVEVMIRCSRNFKISVGMKQSHLEISAETDSSALEVLTEIMDKSSLSCSDLDRREKSEREQKIHVAKSSYVTDEKKKSKKKKWTRFRKLLCALTV